MKKKDRQRLNMINRKVEEILLNPSHYKPLRGDLHGARRVHIGGSFVLLFEVDEKNRIVRLLDFGHHDKIY
ncbi:MAG TPA: type II toxin-antitoxin system mRNA interferase toxin, RelE/StbE family [Candidatus Norongarragalinales archaeon]|nr:type II toxin-antitoxin system mRNA interferase toxin, RelE/StbE family [Candidatus Norongarragalinales archaeon]